MAIRFSRITSRRARKRSGKAAGRSAVFAAIVLVLAIVIPVIGVGIADSLNGVVGDGYVTKGEVRKSTDFSTLPMYVGIPSERWQANLLTIHYTSSDVVAIDKQAILYAANIGADRNQVYIDYSDGTYKAGTGSSLTFNLNVSPKSLMENGVEYIEFNTTFSKYTRYTLNNGDYKERDTGNAGSATVMFYGLTSDGKMELVEVRVTYEVDDPKFGYYSNGIFSVNQSTDVVEFRIKLNQADLLRAATYLHGDPVQSMAIRFQTSGNGVSVNFADGDILEFGIAFLGRSLSGYAVNEIMIGVFGGVMLVGAIFSTSFVNLRRK